MALIKLDVSGLRNIQAASLTPVPGINLIVGANASGKSSLLEAIFVLGRARSFRCHQIKQAIGFDRTEFLITAQQKNANGVLSQLGIRIDQKQAEIRINQESAHKADLAYTLPVQLIHPKSYQLLDAGPQNRREFLDWGVFNQSRQFLNDWRQFQKALQQRNALLKSRKINQLPAWNHEFVHYAELINQYRQRYIACLKPVFLQLASQFLTTTEIDLRYFAGWDEKQSLSLILENELEKDLRYGFTHSGPHRADFLTFHNQRLAKDYLSRGQQKLLMLALLLSQVSLLESDHENAACILIDDLTAELDTDNRSILLKYLSNLGCQVFLTSTRLEDFGDLSILTAYKVFHVKQGQIDQGLSFT